MTKARAKPRNLVMDKLAKTGADVQHTTAERGEKCNGANFNRVKINLEFRKRSTIEIERDNGPSVRSLAFAPPQMTSRHAEKATHANTGQRGKCRQPEADHYRPDKGEAKAPRASLTKFPTDKLVVWRNDFETEFSLVHSSSVVVPQEDWRSNDSCHREENSKVFFPSPFHRSKSVTS